MWLGNISNFTLNGLQICVSLVQIAAQKSFVTFAIDGLLLSLRQNVTLTICLIYLAVTFWTVEMQSLIKRSRIRLKNRSFFLSFIHAMRSNKVHTWMATIMITHYAFLQAWRFKIPLKKLFIGFPQCICAFETYSTDPSDPQNALPLTVILYSWIYAA